MSGPAATPSPASCARSARFSASRFALSSACRTVFTMACRFTGFVMKS
jgi:hypothetical protein